MMFAATVSTPTFRFASHSHWFGSIPHLRITKNSVSSKHFAEANLLVCQAGGLANL